MNRRTALEWISRAIAAACTAAVAVPGLFYIIAPLRRDKGKASKTIVQRLARLTELAAGVPTRFAVTGSRQDAWTLYPEETIGQVWLVRRSDESTPPEQSSVDAYTTVCPHEGCPVEMNSSGDGFVCGCHDAAFKLSGQLVSDEELGRKNPAPRDMDSLKCEVVPDEQSGQWWVEVTYEKYASGSPDKVARA